MAAGARSIDGWLEAHAAHQPDKIALRFEGQAWSYAELWEWVTSLASWLQREQGLNRGDRVAYLGANSPAEMALFFAAARIGAMVVPLNWRLAAEELRFITEDCGARLLVHSDAFAETAKAITKTTATTAISVDALVQVPTAADAPLGELGDPFLIVYTSGTTGQPKGAVLTQEAVFWNALISLHAHDMTSRDHVLNVLPLFHVGGINIQTLPCLYAGGTVSLHAKFDPGEVISELRDGGITTTVLVPTMMRALMAQDGWHMGAFPKLRMLTTGSTDVPVDILQAVNAGGVPMVQVYGATETGPIASYQRADAAAQTIGSIGWPGLHVQMRIVSASGQECATDEPGEVWVKAPNTFSHYWNNPQATEAALTDGWFRTGDVARRDGAGLLWFVSRLKHVIISGGENIYPAEIERILMQMPGLREVAVVGRPDPRWGEVPVVVAAVDPGGPTPQAILSACDPHIAKFKRPKDVVIVPALRRNALGKVLVDEVRGIAAGQTPEG